jgi:hypothetical protein
MTSVLLALMLASAESFPTPSCAAVPGWSERGPARRFDSETLFDYMDGNSEGYFAYGFQLMQGVTCANADGDQLVIDVSQMGDADRAWGIFTANRDVRSPVEPIGSAGQLLPRRATFAKGRFYVEIAANPDKDHRPALRAFVAALERVLPGASEVPRAVAWFPTDGLEPGSLRLVPQSVLGLRLLASGWLAQYAAGRAFVAPAASPDAAASTFAKLRGRFTDAEPVAALGDEAFAARDAYLGGLLVFRKGASLAGVANVAPGQDVTPLARALAGRLP